MRFFFLFKQKTASDLRISDWSSDVCSSDLQATVGTQRRALKVSDLPLGREGVAGYAIDIEEMEEQAREFRVFREAQRSMLDMLSIGVAQFEIGRASGRGRVCQYV